MDDKRDRTPPVLTRDDLPVVTAAAADQLARALSSNQVAAWRRLAALQDREVPTMLTADFDDLEPNEQQARRTLAATALADIQPQLVRDTLAWLIAELDARACAFPQWSSRAAAGFNAAANVRQINVELGRLAPTAVAS